MEALLAANIAHSRAGVVANNYISECLGGRFTELIEDRVEETDSRLAEAEEAIVDERDEACGNRSGGRSTINGNQVITDDSEVVVGHTGDIRQSSSVAVEEVLVGCETVRVAV